MTRLIAAVIISNKTLHVTVAAVESGLTIDVKLLVEVTISKRDDVLHTLGKFSIIRNAETILVDQQSTQALLLKQYSGTVVKMVAAAQSPIDLIEGHVQRCSEEAETREQIETMGVKGFLSQFEYKGSGVQRREL